MDTFSELLKTNEKIDLSESRVLSLSKEFLSYLKTSINLETSIVRIESFGEVCRRKCTKKSVKFIGFCILLNVNFELKQLTDCIYKSFNLSKSDLRDYIDQQKRLG